MALTTNIAAYWKFQSNGNDATPNGNTLTGNNTPTYGTGIIGQAVQFVRASSQSMTIANGSQTGLAITGNITINCWVNLATLPSISGENYWIVSRDNSSGVRGYGFFINSSGNVLNAYYFDASNNLTEWNATSNALTAVTWIMVTAVYTVGSQNIVFYVNGVATTASQTNSAASSINGGSQEFDVGRQSSSDGHYFNGSVDELGVWSRALSGSEITQLYNSGAGLQYPFSSANGNFLTFM